MQCDVSTNLKNYVKYSANFNVICLTLFAYSHSEAKCIGEKKKFKHKQQQTQTKYFAVVNGFFQMQFAILLATPK